jgi:AhpD family alkylhydroperoxidase
MTTPATTSSAPATALKPRMDHWSVAPAFMKGLLDLQLVADSAGIERSLHFLITLRVSQINGCAFCMNMHSAEAKAHGESDQRLFLLSAWHETNLFTSRERAALNWAEVLTRLPGRHVSDTDFATMRAEFTEFEIAAVTLAIATINAWNRFGVGMRPSIDAAAK